MYPLIFDSNGFIASPDRRLNYDTEMSEHSDHTDQSMAESLLSDITKNLNKTVISIDQADLKSQDVVDHKINYTGEGRKEPDKRKSHTLPSQGCSSSYDRPMLSESRTIDILRDCPNFDRQGTHRVENRMMIGRMNSLEHAQEGRVRNTSESSTSGVSSCDSFLGKYAIPYVLNTVTFLESNILHKQCIKIICVFYSDRVLTLSPIPSSSSLYGMKSNSSSQRHRISELQRRTSTSSKI